MPELTCDPRIDLLLAKLRAAGLRVGVAEEVRVHFLLSSQPDIGADLPHTLTAVLAKSERERATVREVCESWATEAAPKAVDPGFAPIGDRPIPQSVGIQKAQRPSRWRRTLRWVVVGLVLSAGMGGITYAGWRYFNRPKVQPEKPKPPIEEKKPTGTTGPTMYLTYRPVFEVSPPPHPLAGWLWLVLLPFGLASALALYRLRRNDLALPEVFKAPLGKSPPRILPSVSESGSTAVPRLLDRQEAEAVVWGIGRFVSEDRTQTLDVPCSVRATVRAGGLPQLRFHAARHTREVWFWLDDSLADDSPLRRLAQELSVALRRGGLHVEVALFSGLPDHLERQGPGEGSVFCPAEVEDRRAAALVCILTDGRLLGHRMEQADTYLATAALLRSLSHWPHLAFVDGGSGALEPLLTPYDLLVLRPPALPSFLAGQSQAPGREVVMVPSGALDGDLRAWAAALALAPFPVDDELAHTARTTLGLQVSAWRLEEVRKLAQQQGVRFAFAAKLRSSLLHFLLEAEGIGSSSLYARALTLWRDVLTDTERQREKSHATQPFYDTPAQRRLQLDRALLDLWDQPEQAAIDLHRLSGAGLGDELRRLLGDYGPRGASPPLIALPWRWPGLSAEARLLLSRLGLGGLTEEHLGLRRPARYAMALAALGTAALAAVFHAAKPAKELGPPQVTQQAPPPSSQAEPTWRTEAIGDRYRVIAELGDSKGQIDAPPRSRVLIRWIEEKQTQQTTIADWCPYQEETHQGIVYVRVCAGEFLMGSAEEDQEAYKDEKPAHRVKLDEFLIGKYEVSNAEYHRIAASHKSVHDRDDQPVNAVDWNQAKAFCEAQGGRLPTEAEWEYAARGRDGRMYPWGNDLPNRKLAVFAIKDAKDNPQEPESVTSHPEGKGPFGALHQAGNVWEWVADCDAEYPKSESVLVNPRVESADCQRRVLRGGSFLDVPRRLRSAFRLRLEPEIQVGFFGFRCVRSVSRQP